MLIYKINSREPRPPISGTLLTARRLVVRMLSEHLPNSDDCEDDWKQQMASRLARHFWLRRKSGRLARDLNLLRLLRKYDLYCVKSRQTCQQFWLVHFIWGGGRGKCSCGVMECTKMRARNTFLFFFYPLCERGWSEQGAVD